MMTTVLLITSIGLPVLVGVMLLTWLRGIDQHRQAILSMIVLALSLVAMLVSLVSNLPPPAVCFSWLPVAGEMCLTFSAPSLLLILFFCLFLLIEHFYPQNIHPNEKSYALSLLAYAVIQIALLSGHFLLRYAALEFVGLTMVAAVLLWSFPIEKRWDATQRVFLNLRLGDMALLAAILVMYSRSGNFFISHNFTAVLFYDAQTQVLLASSLLLAVWVKMAIWPLNQWAAIAASIKKNIRTWLFGLGMPLLGAYLLYRIAPLLHSTRDALLPFVLVLAFLASLSGFLPIAQQERAKQTSQAQAQFGAAWLVLGGFLIEPQVLWAYFLLWYLLRILILWLEKLLHTQVLPQFRLHIIRSVLIHSFTFLGLWGAERYSVSTTILSVLWTLWWAQVLFSASRFRWLYAAVVNEAALNRKAVRSAVGFSLLGGGAFFIGYQLLSVSLSNLVKGLDIPVLATSAELPVWLSSISYAWLGFLFSWPLVFLMKILVDRENIMLFLTHRLKINRTAFNESRLNVLESFGRFGQWLSGLPAFFYHNVEQQSPEKIGNGMLQAIKSVITRVERSTNGNLWQQMTDSLMHVSRSLQRLHKGLLRYNLFWLLLFLVLMVLFVWVSYTGIWV